MPSPRASPWDKQHVDKQAFPSHWDRLHRGHRSLLLQGGVTPIDSIVTAATAGQNFCDRLSSAVWQLITLIFGHWPLPLSILHANQSKVGIHRRCGTMHAQIHCFSATKWFKPVQTHLDLPHLVHRCHLCYYPYTQVTILPVSAGLRTLESKEVVL